MADSGILKSGEAVQGPQKGRSIEILKLTIKKNVRGVWGLTNPPGSATGVDENRMLLLYS